MQKALSSGSLRGVRAHSHLTVTHARTLQSSRNLWAAYTEHKTSDLQRCEGAYGTDDLFLRGQGSHHGTVTDARSTREFVNHALIQAV